jgi:hypothetical protein
MFPLKVAYVTYENGGDRPRKAVSLHSVAALCRAICGVFHFLDFPFSCVHVQVADGFDLFLVVNE